MLSHFDQLNAYRIFLRIVSEGSFAGAARKLHTSPSTVTKEFQKLEELLGCQLLYRTTRSVSLSEQGEAFYQRIKSIVEDIDNLEADLNIHSDSTKGLLRVTAPAVLGKEVISSICASFQKENPYLDMETVFTDRVIDLVDDGFDVAFRTAFQLKDSSMYSQDLGEISRVVVATEKYLKKFGRPRSPLDLENHNCLVFIRAMNKMKWNFSRGDKEISIPVNGNYRCNNLFTIMDALYMDLGIANIPKYLVEKDIKKGKLVQLFKGWHIPAHQLFCLYHQKRSGSKKISRFLDFCSEKLINLQLD